MLDRSKVHVFIIDDDDAIVTLVENTLRFKDFKAIEVAKTGSEGLSILKMPPLQKDGKTSIIPEMNVVILDIMLPDANGFELCKKIKQSIPESLVILISGFDIENLHHQLIQSEADDFLTKPFNPLELAARVDLLIDKYYKIKQRNLEVQNSSHFFARNQLPHVGDQIGECVIVDTLAWGKSSVLYKVLERPENDVYAMKLLTRYSLDFKDVVKRFEHEIEIMSSIDHPNIVKYYKMGNYDHCPYILMEYFLGINLEESLVTMGIPSFETVLDVAKSMASALGELHKSGIIHRDIKLKNIMIGTDYDTIKLTDFGIARWLGEADHITRDGFIVGTPIYMAPEVFIGDASSVQSDIYSYGITLYHYATGSPPYSGKKSMEIYKKHCEATPKSMSDSNPEIPVDFEHLIVDLCMAKSYTGRPESMDEVLKLLQKIKY
jgi:CheY-like chemotaxis protein